MAGDPYRNVQPWHNTEWMEHAACKGTPTKDFFFDQGQNGVAVQAAKAICARCPVTAECLEYAVATRQVFGIWGGMTTKERRVERRRWLGRAK